MSCVDLSCGAVRCGVVWRCQQIELQANQLGDKDKEILSLLQQIDRLQHSCARVGEASKLKGDELKAVLEGTVRCGAVRYGAAWYSAVQCSETERGAGSAVGRRWADRTRAAQERKGKER